MDKPTKHLFILLGVVALCFIVFRLTQDDALYINNSTVSEETKSQNEGEDSQVNPIPAGTQGEFGDEPVSSKPVVVPLPKKITVAGTYSYSEDPKSPVAGKVCFEATQTTNEIGKQFCFDNSDEAFAIFGIEMGFSDGEAKCTISAPATVTIMNYSKRASDVGGYDIATLTNVSSSGSVSFSACK